MLSTATLSPVQRHWFREFLRQWSLRVTKVLSYFENVAIKAMKALPDLRSLISINHAFLQC